MTTTLNSLASLSKVRLGIKVISSKFYSDIIDKPVLVYTNHEKTGCRVNKEDKKKIRLHYQKQYGNLKRGLSYKDIVPFYKKKIVSLNEITNYVCNYEKLSTRKASIIIEEVRRKYPYLANKIDFLCNKVRIWNMTNISSGKEGIYVIQE